MCEKWQNFLCCLSKITKKKKLTATKRRSSNETGRLASVCALKRNCKLSIFRVLSFFYPSSQFKYLNVLKMKVKEIPGVCVCSLNIAHIKGNWLPFIVVWNFPFVSYATVCRKIIAIVILQISRTCVCNGVCVRMYVLLCTWVRTSYVYMCCISFPFRLGNFIHGVHIYIRLLPVCFKRTYFPLLSAGIRLTR